MSIKKERVGLSKQYQGGSFHGIGKFSLLNCWEESSLVPRWPGNEARGNPNMRTDYLWIYPIQPCVQGNSHGLTVIFTRR